MGLILDSTVAISAERFGKNASQMLREAIEQSGEDDMAISVFTILELEHGIVRADSARRREQRQRFMNDLVTVVTVEPISLPIARRAGRIHGHSKSIGIQVPLPDLLIGATALELGYAVGTANVRHFELISGLRVIRL